MMLLLLVAATVSAASLEPALPKAHRIEPVPVHIYGPQIPSIYGPASQRQDTLEHILYAYRFTPSEVNIRHRGQNPITYQVPGAQKFNRGDIESFPGVNLATPLPYIQKNEAAYEETFVRDAVEHVPIEAEPYMAEYEEEEDAFFSRSDVESYPHFPSVYSGGFEDEAMDAYVIETPRDMYGWAGYRAAVESPPLRTPTHDPEEARPVQPQLNSRPFGPWSETLLGNDIPDDDVVEVGGPFSSKNPFGSMAGADLWKYYNDIRSRKSDYKMVCYFGGWSVYRPKPFDFTVTDIDPFSCTHVIYSFAGLKANEYTIQALDEETDIVKGAYKAAVGLKNKNPALKVMIAIGGWNEGGKKYSEMASSKQRREKFVASVVSFLQEHKFDGLDLDWEYPGASDRGGRWSDKANFADLVEELAAAFQPHGWILSAAVSPAKFRVNEGYDVPRLAQHLDFINIMTYDLRGPWDGKADHHAPISSRPSDSWAYKALNTKDGIAYWAEKGAPKEKLLMGIPFYGRTFTLASSSSTQPGSRAKSGGNEGQYTQERGFLAYYEVCQEMRNGGWDMQQDAVGGPYMSKGDQWIGWDDVDYVTKKMELVKSEGLGGAMIWAIDLDDYLGVCGDRWPLLSAMRRGLGLNSVPSDTIPVTLPTAPPTPDTTKVTPAAPPVEETTLRPAEVTSTPISSKLTTPSIDVNLPCNEGSYIRDPKDCSSYMLCVHGEWQKFSCQPPLQWDQNKRICDWPSNVKCTPSAPGTGSSPDSTGSAIVQTTPTPTTKPTPPPPSVELESVRPSGSLSGDYMVVCYFTNWAWYRPGLGKYKPEDIDPTICTHIVYGFAVLDYSNLIIKPHDTWADFDNKFYEKVTALKAKGIKVTIAIGGWNDSAGDKYSRLVNNPAARAKFITHVVEFIKKHNFDGLDLDWEYPVCWQVDCKKGPPSDKEAFAMWVKELSVAFKPHGLLLSAAVSPSKKVIDAGYDVPTLSQYMDWIAVMTYDFHGHWDKKTGHVAPMYPHPEDDYDYFNMDYAIRYWIEKGAAKNKLVLGMPLYGQSFSLNDPTNTGLNSPARSGGQAGEFTRARGFLAYYEICHFIQQGWTVVTDPEGRMGPYAYSGNQWVSFDDVETIRRKSEYIREMGLAGGMVWALDLDDFRNRCGQGAHPLMNTIKAVLGPANGAVARPGTGTGTGTGAGAGAGPVSTPPPKPITMPEPVSRPEPEPEPEPKPEPVAVAKPPSTSIVTPSGSDYKVVCYFTNWAWYRPGEGKYTPDHIDASLCTHIVYGFAVLNGNNLLIKPHDSWADFDNKFYERVTALRAQGVKVLVAIGGWNDSAGNKYSRLVNNPTARARFTEHVIQFIQQNNFDGLDLDWEYPVCWQVNCNKGPASDKDAFSAWVRELKIAFEPHGLLLSAAVSPSNKVIDAGYDVPVLSQYLDWIAVMTYDYHGQWDKKTGHVAPMYAHSTDENLAFNTNFTIHYWIEKGADRKKLVLGMPMYGQSFTLASSQDNGLLQKSYGGGEAGQYTRARGFLAYYEICYKIRSGGWTVVRDSEGTMGPYAYKGNQWVGFDDVHTIRYKSEYIKKMGLGGGMIWALDLDDFKNRCGCEMHPLLRTINRVLRNIPVPDPGCPLLGGAQPTMGIVSPGTRVVPDQTAISPATPKPVIAVTPTSTRGTECQTGERRAHPSNCNMYYECVFGKLEERRCFAGLHWNGKDRCDWPSNARCTSGSSPSESITQPPVPTPPPTTTPNPWWPPTSSTTASVSTTPPTHIETIIPDTGYKVVCYFTNWAWYRQTAGKYRPEDIDPNLCTHIVYGFAVLDGTRLLIKPHDTWADYDNKFYEKVTALRARGIKVTIAIGGWNDSAGDKYSRLVNNPEARRKFNEHVIEFIKRHNFDGLDLDWEYPVCWQVNCKKGPASDKAAFAEWIKELHYAFKPHGLLLSAAVSPSNKVIDAGYDVPALNRYLDWIAVMTYDYHGHWDKKTGHVAPMYLHPDDENVHFNSNFTIHYWMEKGADRKKLIMGMPLYGQSFSLASASDNGLNQKAYGRGTAGEYTRAGGFLAYYEICDRVLNKGFTVVKDPEGRMGPYAYKGNQWFGYDDIAMIRYKSEWVKKMGLGGGMIWALDLDDFKNRCGCEPHPLLRTINRVLRSHPDPDPRCNM